jgi:hypothetical protein
MPSYLYRIRATESRFEAVHGMTQYPKTLGELCEVAGLELAGRDPGLEVERLIQPVAGKVQDFRSDIRDRGFSKMVKRSDGTYENMTGPKGGPTRSISDLGTPS